MIFAVIDTNVIVSALLTQNRESTTYQVVESVMNGVITPLFNSEIIDEYEEVLSRPKFGLSADKVRSFISMFRAHGLESARLHCDESFPDIDDAVFYEVAISQDSSYLVTGNVKHFPKKAFVVSPAEMMEIVRNGDKAKQSAKSYSFDEVRKENSNAYEKWTEKDDDLLARLYAEGTEIPSLMELFGRSRGSIRSRLIKLGLIKP